MAEVFVNARAVLGTTAADVYECPASTKAIVLLAQVSNTTASSATATVQWTDSSNSAVVTRLITATPVPANQSMSAISGKLVLEAGDKIQALGGTALAIELTLSILELS